MNLIMTMIHENSFEVLSVAATKLPNGWWPYDFQANQNRQLSAPAIF